MDLCSFLQVDEASIRDVCSEYGIIHSCLMDMATESALVHYGSQEEAALAKAGLDKNPAISGVSVAIDFATEAEVLKFYEIMDPKSGEGRVCAPKEETPEWYNEPVGMESNNSPSMPHKWGEDPGLTFTAKPNETADLPTPTGTSLWSNNGFLPGLASPWHTNFTSGRDKDDHAVPGTGSTLSTFLPNGLF